jgi:GNAT superfamily N-acetyltransferase
MVTKVRMKSFTKIKTKIVVKEGEKHLWKIFHPHHYMTANKPIETSFPNGAKFYTFYWVLNGVEILVGCAGVLFQISKVQESKRLTRIVVLPEYQGLGFGSKIVNLISEYYTDLGFKVYSATYHPRLGKYRENSNLWEPTHYNQREFKLNDDYVSKGMSGIRDGVRMYRHSYKKPAGYILFYNPVKLSSIERELFNLEKNLTLDNYQEYTELYNQAKVIWDIIGVQYQKKSPRPLSINTEGHRNSKEEHKRIFNKPKRKPLSKLERKQLKEKQKIES